MAQVQVDRAKCEGYGNCVSACPSVFDLDDEGLVVLNTVAAAVTPLEDLRRAAYDCPTGSITVTG